MLLYTLSKMGVPDFRQFIGEYHAEMFETDRLRIIEDFRKPDSTMRCLVSTVAFGMGIDIPDIKLIIHWGESDTIVQYWQEIGRCGRDGLPAKAILYHIGTQLFRCQPDMKDLISKVKKGHCIRQGLLDRLQLAEMSKPGNASGTCVAKCCSVCAVKCPCSLCSDSDNLAIATSSLNLDN